MIGNTKFSGFVSLKAQGPSCPSFKLGESELPMFDHFAQEHVEASGTVMLYWHQDLENSSRDPLYDEPMNRVWRGPYELTGYAEYMAATPQMREEGLEVKWNGVLWIARKEFEDKGAPLPLEGDVFQFWGNTFFKEHSVNSETGIDNAGYYFDVVNVDEIGHLNDTGSFVGLTINVIRRTSFTPERRLVQE